MSNTYLDRIHDGSTMILYPKSQFEHRFEWLRNEYNAIRRSLECGECRHVLVDFSRAQRIESNLIGILLSISAVVSRKGGCFYLCAIPSELKHTLKSLLMLERGETPVNWRGFRDRISAQIAIDEFEERIEEIIPVIAVDESDPTERTTFQATQYWGPVAIKKPTAEDPTAINQNMLLDVYDRWILITEKFESLNSSASVPYHRLVTEDEATGWLVRNEFVS